MAVIAWFALMLYWVQVEPTLLEVERYSEEWWILIGLLIWGVFYDIRG